ncbi:MAG: hypothetical protein KJP18_16540, partial [Gemmatimonadetes bacterium]|nr:hypothetical protein [Gemmatimonadota bacterium]
GIDGWRGCGPIWPGPSQDELESEWDDMRVFTPAEVAKNTYSKYLGVLVAAKYARELNSLPREVLPLGEEKKLTTRSLEALTSGQIEFRLVGRRKRED